MNKKLTVTLKVDAKTGEVTAVRNSFDDLDKKVGSVQSSLTSMTSKLVAVVGFTGAVYGLAKAFSFVVRSGFDYNKSMDASTAKLTAMISASKGYVTVTGEQVTAMQRQKLIAQETEYMMQILKTTNAQTAMGMSELVDIYSLAKPGMDKYNWAVEDQIEIVKLASNTASVFGMTAEELSTGIDDLASGTWEASSGFGKMMKTLGVSREEYKATADKVAYLKEKMKETGEAQDTWAVATSNLQVAWDNMAGQITQPIFDGVKEAIKYITAQMNDYAPDAMQVFSDALVDMVNGGISAVGTLIGWISKLVSGFKIAYAGYKKLAGAARVWWNGNDVDNSAKLKALEAEQAALKKTGQGYGVVRAKIRALKRDMQASGEGAKLWAEADKDLEDIAAFDAKMQDIAKSVKKIKISKGAMAPIAKAIEPSEQLAYKVNAVADATNKKSKADSKATSAAKAHTRALQQQAKAASQALKAQRDLHRKYMQITGDENGLFQFDVEETMQEFIDSGRYNGEELSKIYDAMWDKYQDKAKESSTKVNTWLQDAFDIDSGSIGEKLFDGLWDSLQGFASAFKSNDPFAVSNATGDLITSSLDTLIPGAGTALKTFGALLSTTLSEAEIKAAAGRTEFDSEGTSEIISTLDGYMQPQLTATRSMLTHLESMDTNLIQALNASSSLDLSGSNYTPQTSSIAGGIVFASSTELIGAGIKFYDQAVSGFVKGVEADGYESVKKTSSLFGIFTSESVSESLKELPQGTKDQIGEAFNQGLQSALDGLDILGFNTDAIEAKIQNYVVSLGKINFQDLTVEEQAEALNRALTQELNSALGDALDFAADPKLYYDLQRLATAGEETVSTISRVAVGFETVSTSLGALGQSIETFNQSQALIDAAGGLSEWNSAQDEFIGMLSDGEQKQYYQNLLSTALATYDVALPASKAQFIALKNETEAKIISLKASIDVMETELAAKVQSGEISLAAAYGELDGKADIANAQADIINKQVKDNNYLIDSSNNAGHAVVGFGNSVHSMVKGMATGAATASADAAKSAVDQAGKIDYSQLHSASLDAARAELGKLEGLYGTLMSNMGDFSSYYGSVETATNSATSALSDFEKQMLDIANFKAELTNNKVDSAKIVLDATTKSTGLTSLTTENILEELNKNMGALSEVPPSVTSSTDAFASSCSAVDSSCSSAASSCSSLNTQLDATSDANQSLLQDYKDQYAALKAYQEAVREQERGFEDLEMLWNEASDLQNAQVALNRIVEDTGLVGVTYGNFLDKMNEGIANGDGVSDWQQLSSALRNVYEVEKERMNSIKDAYTGSLSYFNSREKSEYLAGVADSYKDSANNTDYISALQDQLAEDKKISRTREEYAEKFDKYIEQLKGKEPKKTLDDVVTVIEDLNDEFVGVKKELKRARLQGVAS